MVNVRGARSGSLYDARAGQAVLKLDPGNAWLRPRCRSEAPFPTGDAAHGMCFVEQEQSVELVAEPCQDLVKSAIATSFASQGGVGSEQDGIADLDPGAGTDTAQGLNVERRPAERLPVAAGVLARKSVG